MAYTSNEFTVDEVGFIQIAHTRVLAAVARGELDLNLIAREELAARGFDDKGVWVGFERGKFAPGPLRPTRPPDASRTGLRLLVYLLVQKILHGRK